jgi:hypothetical protein
MNICFDVVKSQNGEIFGRGVKIRLLTLNSSVWFSIRTSSGHKTTGMFFYSQKAISSAFVFVVLLGYCFVVVVAVDTESNHKDQPTCTTLGRSFVISGNEFLKDGQPFRILSGELTFFAFAGFFRF